MTAAATVCSEPSAESALLRCVGLVKRFGEREVLREISFSLGAGEFVALIGPNGAGKSTLLGTLVGLILPDSGSTHILDQDVTQPGEGSRLELGYVPQEFRGFDWMQTGELLDYIAAFYPRARRRWRDLEDWAELPRRTRVRELSGGQRQRLAILVALRHRPKVALLDEPVSSLDPKARRDFVQLLHSDVKARGAVCLLSSHILSDLEPLADRSLILHQGRLLGDWDATDRREDLRWLYPLAPASSPQDLPTTLEVLATTAEGGLLVGGWRRLSEPERAQLEQVWRSLTPADMESVFLALTSGERP